MRCRLARALNPLKRGGKFSSSLVSLCNNRTMSRSLTFGTILFCGLTLAACSGDDASTASVERGAASASQIALCVQNDSSLSISSSGDGSPTQPEGFLVRPGERACATSDPNTDRITQSMMSDVGPSWTTEYSIEEDGGPVTYIEAKFTTCGRTWKNEDSINEKISCSGNPFQITVNFSDSGSTSTAEITFADQ